MSKYVIIHGQMVELSDDELMHWKYIKRERKNGKWKYYYDQSELDNLAKNANNSEANAVDKTLKAYEARNKEKEALSKWKKAWSEEVTARYNRYGDYVDKYKKLIEAEDELRSREHQTKVAEKVEQDAYKQAERDTKKYKVKEKMSAPARAVAKGMVKTANALTDYTDGIKQDWKESKERGTKKAIEEATKYDGGIVIKGDGTGAKKIGKTTFADVNNWLSSTTTIELFDTQFNDVKRGKIDRAIDTAKEYVKDRLGYDERDAFKVANAKYEFATNYEKNYQDITTSSRSTMGKIDPKDGSITFTDAEKERIKEQERFKEKLRENTTKAGKEASDAAYAYNDTVLGKIEKMSNKRDKRKKR